MASVLDNRDARFGISEMLRHQLQQEFANSDVSFRVLIYYDPMAIVYVLDIQFYNRDGINCSTKQVYSAFDVHHGMMPSITVETIATITLLLG